MDIQQIFNEIKEHTKQVLEEKEGPFREIWNQFLKLHPADSAQFLASLDRERLSELFNALPKHIKIEVFHHFSDTTKITILSSVDSKMKADLLKETSIDELTDIFELLSNEELKEYLMLLNYHERQKVLSLLKFNPQSAAGIMETDVLTFRDDFTVEKAIHVLQRLKLERELYKQIYVINRNNQLVGYINLEDLVLKSPKDRLTSFMHKNEIVALAQEDQEAIANKMMHYQALMVPVVGDNNIFLGVIPSEALIKVIEQEASENVYHISAMPALPRGYFDTSFFRLLYERSYILVLLLLMQSFSTMIIRRYETMLAGFLMLFITMLTSTGGNSSSQASVLVIQGMASGEINKNNLAKFLKREMLMASIMAVLLGIFSFFRVYFTYHYFLGSFVVSISLAAIVFCSIILGSGIPVLLRKLRIDPAFAAAPFLATIMDIFGLLIYCYISNLILGSK